MEEGERTNVATYYFTHQEKEVGEGEDEVEEDEGEADEEEGQATSLNEQKP